MAGTTSDPEGDHADLPTCAESRTGGESRSAHYLRPSRPATGPRDVGGTGSDSQIRTGRRRTGTASLTRALFLFQAGQMEESYQVASSQLDELRNRGLANALVVHLQTGLGSIRGRQGRYEEAAGHHERALRLARLLGNDTLTAHICANLARAYGRLGRFEDHSRAQRVARSRAMRKQ